MNALPPAHIPNAHNLYEDIDYPRYWDGIARQKLDNLEHHLVRDLLPTHGQRLIDIGCGYGRLYDCYVNRLEQIVLFDGSESLLRMAQEKTHGKALYVLGDVNHLPFQPATFDSVLMIRVFHHIDNSAKCLVDLHRILCKDGYLVMNYSNKRNALRIAQFVLKRTSLNPFTLEPLTVEANFFHHHPASVSGLLTDAGFGKPILRGAGMMDKIAAAFGALSKIIPHGFLLAPLLGITSLAPWIFCKTTAIKKEMLRHVASFEDLFKCPRCAARLTHDTHRLECIECKSNYPIRNGLIDMRID